MRVGDRRRAESLFIVASGVIALVLVLSQYLGWAMLQPSAREPSFFLLQGLLAGAYALVCLVGRQPEISVRIAQDHIEIRRRSGSALRPWALGSEEEVERIAFRRILRISTVDAGLYYRHYARYAATRAFVNRIHPKLLMIEDRNGPIILGLDPRSLVVFLKALDERTESASSSRVM